MKLINKIITYLSSFLIFFIFLILSAYFICYKHPTFFKNEFRKYDIANILNTDENELIKVKDEMMNYLIDKKESLEDITFTTKNKQNLNFFNDKEILHMLDVKNIFTKTKRFLFLSFAFIFILLNINFYLNKNKAIYLLAHSFIRTFIIFLCFLVSFFILIFSNFNKYFIIFIISFLIMIFGF